MLTVTVVAVTTPLALWPVYVACLGVLVAVAAVAAVRPAEIWRRSCFVLPVVALLAAFVPFVRAGGESWAFGPLTVHEAGLTVAATVAAKALIGTLGAVLLGATTSFPQVLRALEALRVPRPFVLIAALCTATCS